MNLLKMYQKEIKKFPLLSAKAEEELFRKVRQNDHAAREKIISANLRLVVSIAWRHRKRGVPLEDLIQEGNIGLMRAVEKFDPRRKERFSTYAGWVVLSAITTPIREAKKRRLEQSLVNLTDDVDEEFTNPALIDSDTPYELILKGEEERIAKEFINIIRRKKDNYIIRNQYGFTKEPFCLKSIGKKYGISIEAVKKIKKRALKTMRKHAEQDEYRLAS